MDKVKVKSSFDKSIKDDSASNILMELRKAANHPLLRRTLYDDEKLEKMARLVYKVSYFNLTKIKTCYKTQLINLKRIHHQIQILTMYEKTCQS